MNTRRVLAIATVAALSVCSCQKPEDFGEANVQVDKNSIEFTQDGGNQTIALTATVNWEITGLEGTSEWLDVSPSKGNASKSVQTITVKTTANVGADRTATLTFYGDVLHKAIVVITQKGPKGGDTEELLSVKDFLTKKDTQTAYRLEGVIGNISKSEKYYGFYLKDSTGEICCSFPENWSEYSSSLHTGDNVAITGKYSWYESKSQDQMSNGTIKSHVAVPQSQITTVTVADFISKADAYSLYRLTGTVNSTVSATYCSFDLKDASGTIKVYTVNNASEWASKLKKGDTVTLRGAYQLYNTTHEVVDADIESSQPGQGGDDEKITGENLITNGGFETWNSGKPANWTFVSGNATVTQSSEYHSGSSSASVAGVSGSNKRLMSDEYTLKPGTYQISVFTKGEGKFKLGYGKVTNHKIADTSNDYIYLTDSAVAAGTDWTETYVKFTLADTTTVSLIVMNNKEGNGSSFLVDDVALVTKDGGVVTGGGTGGGGQTLDIKYEKLSLTSFKEGKYAIAMVSGGKIYIMKNEVKSQYYVTAEEFDLTSATAPGNDYLFTVKADGSGYTVQNQAGGYVGCEVSGTHYNLKPSLTDKYVWTFTAGTDGAIIAKGANSGDYCIVYYSKYNEFTMGTGTADAPTFYLISQQ